MSRRVQTIFFVVLGLVLSVAIFLPYHRHPKPKKHLPLEMGDELNPGDRIYADGRISLAAGSEEPVLQKGCVLFLSIRDAKATGAPLAEKQIVNPNFPLRLFMTNGNNNGAKKDFFEESILVSGHLSQEGKVNSKKSGDWEGSVIVEKGSNRLVELVLLPVKSAS